CIFPQDIVGRAMGRLSIASVLIMLSLGVAAPAGAKSLSEAENPAEFPPSDYNGRQYVDSAGCVYVRAGFDGNVKWVPRVTRQRQVVCGQTPTFARAQPTRVAPPVRPAVVANRPAPVSASPQAAPRPAPRVAAPQRHVAQAAPRPTQARRVAAPRVLAAPTIEIVRAPHPPKVGTQAARGCSGGDRLTQRYTNPGARCGPQQQSPSSGFRVVQGGTSLAASSGGVIQITGTSGAKRVVPVAPKVPHGFRPVWKDGRLNPYRGVPTFTNAPNLAQGGPIVISGAPGFHRGTSNPHHGYDLAWTKSPPHLLFDRRSGLVVGHEFPQLKYPNTSVSGHVTSTKSGATAPRAVISTKAAPRATPKFETGVARQAPRQAAAAIAPSLAHRHVQVATYASSVAARADAQRLANAGLPTRVGKYTRDGQRREVIVLGPFNSASALNSALGTARAYGFSGAFSRK
ncbi:MAG: SPOR domain-containing protein, partial [Pseudomonadota bacterium]